MKRWIAAIVALMVMASVSWGLLTFYLVDNFEDGTFSKWTAFDNAKLSLLKNPKLPKRDLVQESCGEYALEVQGAAKDWYVGGVSTNLSVNAADYSRFSIDVNGIKAGKIKIELYQDDNKTGEIEQDVNNAWKATSDSIWSIEIPIIKNGYTRYSLPLTAFAHANPGIGSDKLGGAPILKMQAIFIASEKEGSVDCAVDNMMFTY